MTIQSIIESKLTTELKPFYMEVVNESHMHGVPANSETHFKLVLVSSFFNDLRQVSRHQKIYHLLKDELDGPVHALALHTYSLDEWQLRNGGAPESPDCLGGSKAG